MSATERGVRADTHPSAAPGRGPDAPGVEPSRMASGPKSGARAASSRARTVSKPTTAATNASQCQCLWGQAAAGLPLAAAAGAERHGKGAGSQADGGALWWRRRARAFPLPARARGRGALAATLALVRPPPLAAGNGRVTEGPVLLGGRVARLVRTGWGGTGRGTEGVGGRAWATRPKGARSRRTAGAGRRRTVGAGGEGGARRKRLEGEANGGREPARRPPHPALPQAGPTALLRKSSTARFASP